MQIKVDAVRRFHTNASLSDVFSVLSDVPRSVSHYPDVEALHKLQEGEYRWELRTLGTAGFSHQVVYACRYVSDANAGTVTWQPVSGVGNGTISGQWVLSEDSSGTWVDFRNEGFLTIPVPRMLKRLATTFVIDSFEGQIERYLANLNQTFRNLNQS